MITAPEHGAATLRRPWVVAEVLLVFCVFFLHAGWPAPEVNEPHYLGKAMHYWNPGWCAGDFFLESADAHEVFYWSSGWLTRLMPLPAAAWTGRLVTWLLLAWAWRRASFALVPRPLFAVLGAALFVALNSRYHLAGEWVVGGFEAKGLAYVLVLLGIEACQRNRWNRAWLLLGAAAAFHVLVGGWAVAAAALCWFISRGDDRPTIRSMLPSLAGGMLLSLPGLVPALALHWETDAQVVTEANQIYVYKRLPHHLALLTLRPGELQDRLVRNLILLAVFAALAYITPTNPALRRLRAVTIAAMLFAACGFIIDWTTENNPVLGATLLRYYWFRLYDVALPLALSMYGVTLLSEMQSVRPRWHLALLLGLLGFAGWHLGDTLALRRGDLRPPADRKMDDAADWQAACMWIRENTPADARFFIPRGAATFKWYAKRCDVVNQKDIPQDAEGIVEWWRRLDDIYRRPTVGSRSFYPSLAYAGETKLVELGKTYGADYVVAEREPRLRFQRTYANPTYAVYRLPSSADVEAPVQP